jgi:HSP20 family molecular chaperone IbpA
MTERKRPAEDDPLSEIARGLEGLMGQFGAALGEAMSRLGEGQGSASSHSRVFDTGKGPVRAEIGLRVRGLGAEVPGEGFRPRTRRPDPAAAPEPAPAEGDTPRSVTLTGYADRGGWTLAADLPGVEPDDVQLSVTDATLHLSTRGSRTYRGSAALPPGLDTAAMTMTLRNGILAVYFPAAGGTAP